MKAQFASSRPVRARKTHTCMECLRAIRPGEFYLREAGCWEGDFWQQKTCMHCGALRELVAEVDGGYMENYYGGLVSWVTDLVTEFKCGPTLLRGAVNFKRKWQRPDGSLVEVPTSEARTK